MATYAISSTATASRRSSSIYCPRPPSLSGMQPRVTTTIRVTGIAAPSMSISTDSYAMSGGRRFDWRVYADGKQQCVEPSSGTSAEGNLRTTDASFHNTILGNASSTSRELYDMFQSWGWSDSTVMGNALLRGVALTNSRVREVFASGGSITEENMEKLVDGLLREGGQSKEDHQRRAELLRKIASFFLERKSFVVEEKSSSEVSKTMQVLADLILAEEGRSAKDYNARAQFFAKSAEVFPFNSDARST